MHLGQRGLEPFASDLSAGGGAGSVGGAQRLDRGGLGVDGLPDDRADRGGVFVGLGLGLGGDGEGPQCRLRGGGLQQPRVVERGPRSIGLGLAFDEAAQPFGERQKPATQQLLAELVLLAELLHHLFEGVEALVLGGAGLGELVVVEALSGLLELLVQAAALGELGGLGEGLGGGAIGVGVLGGRVAAGEGFGGVLQVGHGVAGLLAQRVLAVGEVLEGLAGVVGQVLEPAADGPRQEFAGVAGQGFLLGLEAGELEAEAQGVLALVQ